MPPMGELAAFKAAARAAILTFPGEFTLADLAGAIGGSQGEERLRWFLRQRTREGLLERVAEGRYRAVEALSEPDALGAAAGIETGLREAFYALGGVATFAELLAELGREEEGLERHVRRVLDGSPRYVSGSPIPGYRRHWRLVDAERRLVPIPGRLVNFDLLMAAGGRANRGHAAILRGRRAQIAAGLREARELTGVSVAEMIATPGVAAALAFDLSCATLPASVGGRGTTLSAWWTAEVAAHGRERALAKAWAALEAADDPYLFAVGVRFWVAVGKRLKLDPAYLSRGCAVRA
jgi:hypothetical protein